MKKNASILKIFVGLFTVLISLHISANLVSAQCGDYFKQKYNINSKIRFNDYNYTNFDDWNGDGKSDFWDLRSTGSGSGFQLVIYPSKPSGYWDWDNPVIYSTSISSNNTSYKAIDINSDGRKDLVATYAGYAIQVHLNNGNGSLVALPLQQDTPIFTREIGFADINGDHLLDYLYTIYNGSGTNSTAEIRYKLQNADGSFANSVTVLTGSATNGLNYSIRIIGDFNGDGKIDILYNTTDIDNTNKYVLLKNLGGGNFEIGTPVTSDLSGNALVKDFNNDGKADILNIAPNTIIIFYGQANGTFERRTMPGLYTGAVAADLNGDNNLDIIQIGESSYMTHINNGAGGFTQTSYAKAIGDILSRSFIVEDFSGDGKPDLYEINFPNRMPTNIFGEQLIKISVNFCQKQGETKLTNFDGNVTADIATWNPANGIWSSKNAVWGSGADTTSRSFQWGLGSLGDVPSPGDFDGDGKTDYSVYRNSTGVWYIFRSSDSSWMTFQFGTTGDIPVPNDYDGGGKTDIAVWRPSNGGWYIWHSETQQFLGVQFGQSGDKPVAADYDGDGKTDIAVFRPSSGVWYYLKSSNNYSFAAIQWGISTDKPVPADYDGDGKADLTIYRDGVWWILRSSNNSYIAIQWGTANDIPIPVYRNSISADMTLYNPANNTWNYFANRYSPGITIGESQSKPVYFGLPND